MDFDYIVVQAGGKGTRMKQLTANKPKCLVPVNSLPMLFHLFRKYPGKRFIIIGDYKYEALREYLRAFAEVKYLLVNAGGKQGTCAGLREAAGKIPSHEAFMLIWSDLILPDDFAVPEGQADYVGLSGDFQCRWKYQDGVFAEEASAAYGVAGLFLFQNKEALAGVPEEGEFVRWLQSQGRQPEAFTLSRAKEYGLLEEYKKLGEAKCRPFNSMQDAGGKIVKTGIDRQGRELAARECGWYRHVQKIGIKAVPEIYSYDPLCMEKIDGKNIYEYQFPAGKRAEVLEKIIAMLQELHGAGRAEPDYFSMKEAYAAKTFARLDRIRDLVPFADKEYITVNQRKCRNVFFYKKDLEDALALLPAGEFKLLHGDCTFSNMMLRQGEEPVMIDPRGYFGHTELYGDPAYDWAKLYYSIKGNYDRFNLKHFTLAIGPGDVSLEIESNGWEDMEGLFFELLKDEVDERQIKLIHAVIWLSLTTYAWDDYDSICGAFYNGIYYLEEVL